MEYKRSSHVEEEEEEEEEEDEDEEDEEEQGHHQYTTAAVTGATQQLHPQVLGSSASSPSSLMDSAAFSRPLLPPNLSLVSPSPPPPGGSYLHAAYHHGQGRRVERERTVETVGGESQLQRHHEPARNGVLGGGAGAHPGSTLALVGGGGVGPRAGEGAAGEAPTWRYRECLKNHAARMGAHVLDGCGEFMSSPGDGAAALSCAACGCHRSFHRRESAVVAPASLSLSPAAAGVVSPSATPTGANSSRLMPLLLAPPHMQKRPPVLSVSPASAPAALAESSSEELRPPPPPLPASHPHAQAAAVASASAPPGPSKKRFRTKFTAEQKERMREFAHRVGWRIHKPDAAAVDAFCAQVGVSRRVLKVWMHNNKHLAKTPPSPTSQPPPPPPPLHHDPSPPPPPHHHHHHHHHHHPPQHHQQQQQHDA